jgi:Amt family ammonium transporter
LAGLVGITAGCAAVSPTSSVIIGAIAGVIVVFGIQLLDNARIDDPVGAITVHGICGVWGTLAVGLFGGANLATQAIGTFSISGLAFVGGYVVFLVLKPLTGGLRVSAEDEIKGLDFTEHGTEAYSNADSLSDPVVVGTD